MYPPRSLAANAKAPDLTAFCPSMTRRFQTDHLSGIFSEISVNYSGTTADPAADFSSAKTTDLIAVQNIYFVAAYHANLFRSKDIDTMTL